MSKISDIFSGGRKVGEIHDGNGGYFQDIGALFIGCTIIGFIALHAIASSGVPINLALGLFTGLGFGIFVYPSLSDSSRYSPRFAFMYGFLTHCVSVTVGMALIPKDANPIFLLLMLFGPFVPFFLLLSTDR